jgi:hypothetical protein
VGWGRFNPFLVGKGCMSVSILQYADDTLCIGETMVDNLWAIKAVLRGFEIVKVNFWKSCIMGVNVTDDFLCMAAGFLNCRICHSSFKYLGLPVGANLRLRPTWLTMLDSIRGDYGHGGTSTKVWEEGQF